MSRILAIITLITLAAYSNNAKGPNFAPVDDRSITTETPAYYQGRSVRNQRISSGNLQEITPGSQAELVATIGDRVFFDFNSRNVNAAGKETLNRQAEWLKSNRNITISIEGHADERGTREYNLALGERRAYAVKEYLITLGIPAKRISSISYGKEHPEYLGSDEVSWSKNRRAVTVVNY